MKRNEKHEKLRRKAKEASKGTARDGSKKLLFLRNVVRTREAIEARKNQVFSTQEKKKKRSHPQMGYS